MPGASDFELLAADIRRQPELLASRADGLRRAAESVATKLPNLPSRIYLVGCGDSLNVGMAVRFAWEWALGVPVDAVPALTFSRFSIETAPPGALVVALSQSGTVVRVVEAIRKAHLMGLSTLAITGTAGSPLALEPSTAQIVTNFPKLGFVPGTASYALNLALFFELASAFAARWGAAPGVDSHIRDQVDRMPDLLSRSLDATWTMAKEHAKAISERGTILILGTGPNLANAHFLARKMFEVTQTTALSQEAEEYAHDEISIVNSQTAVVQFVVPDASLSRSLEILDSVLTLGCPTAIVTERGSIADLVKPSRLGWVYEVASGLDQLFTAPLYALPASVLTYELAQITGGSYYTTDDPIHAAQGDKLIYGSQLVV